MAQGIIGLIREKLKQKQSSQTQQKPKKQKAIDNIFKILEPQCYTMARENNIACKYKDYFIITKDANVSMGIELKGASYAGLSLDDETDYLLNRVMFFTTLKDDVEVNIAIKKQKIKSTEQKQNTTSLNPYAKEIINKWENNQDIYEIKYFLIVSTIKKNIAGALESFKNKATQEEQADGQDHNIKQGIQKLKEILEDIKNYLSIYQPRQMSADELINFYATYSNAQETNLKYTNELLSDVYISSYTEFKKDYIEFELNDGRTKYSRFISVKAYETEAIKSAITSNLIKYNNEFMTFIHIKAYEKQKAIKKIKDVRAFSVDIIKEELSELMELIQADRENLAEICFSIYVIADSLDELDKKSNDLKNILQNQGLNAVRENINQKALYFSFFPSRGNLNARKKTLNISNLSTIANFENEVRGFNKNDWGKEAVTQFKHLNGTPFLFNFHCQPDGDKPSGHTMIIGGTGSGKTTLAQFLMNSLYKYPIDIFAMDKLRGMYNFTNYTDGEYHDSESKEFKLNPFSLADTHENREFLKKWLQYMAEIQNTEHDAINDINQTIDRLFENKQSNQILSLNDFIISLPAENESKSKLKTRFSNYSDSVFDNKEDALNFTKQLSVLNMDSILTDHKTAGLTAIYIFHKLKNQAKNNQNKRGFFCFIDELKDYLNDEIMQEKILEAILEVRKIGGVMCMGFQSMSLFKNMSRGSSFLDNIANYIIYPTNNESTIEELKEMVGLTPSEAKFLREAGGNSRKILLKMKLRNESAILDVNLSSLQKYLKVFSSSSNNVMLMKRLQQESPKHWRKNYLE